MKRLIIFLIRRYLGLKIVEKFQFANQKSKNDLYYFTRDSIAKIEYHGDRPRIKDSSVSLNYLLSDECEIVVVDWL